MIALNLARVASRRCNASSVTAKIAARSFGSTTPTSISESEVKGLFSLWNDALATLDGEKVADRYASDAVLLPTVSDSVRDDRAGIVDYFAKDFLPKKPQGTILESWVKVGDCGKWAQDNGVYEFVLGATGDVVKARYTFVYAEEDGEWKIVHHHSSAMPEGMLAAATKLADIESVLAK